MKKLHCDVCSKQVSILLILTHTCSRSVSDHRRGSNLYSRRSLSHVSSL